MGSHTFTYRVRYAETDQMGTFYNARALEWFEVGRSELSRSLGVPYTEWEARGVFMPLVEAGVKYKGTARYDDLLQMRVWTVNVGRVRMRFEYEIRHAGDEGKVVATGFTVHALVDSDMRPMRLPDWVRESMGLNGE